MLCWCFRFVFFKQKTACELRISDWSSDVCSSDLATVVELSWYGSTPVALPLGEDFHAKRLSIRSSQVGAVATAQRGRWTHARRMAQALELLRDPALDALVDGESRFAELPKRSDERRVGKECGCTGRYRWSPES